MFPFVLTIVAIGIAWAIGRELGEEREPPADDPVQPGSPPVPRVPPTSGDSIVLEPEWYGPADSPLSARSGSRLHLRLPQPAQTATIDHTNALSMATDLNSVGPPPADEWTLDVRGDPSAQSEVRFYDSSGGMVARYLVSILP